VPQTKDKNPPEHRFDDHSVIVPKHALKGVVRHTREPGTFAMDVVARAEAALAELKSEFGGWMSAECERADQARLAIRTEGLNSANMQVLYHSAHDIKGTAETLGFPLATRIAISLCRLLRHAPDIANIPLALIDHHVDAIRAIVREQLQGTKNDHAVELAERLAIMVEKYLAAEMKDGYAEIAADAVEGHSLPVNLSVKT
jgi:chemotaxis protein histidine kinase CheA